ncbi:hypothetical protein QO002_002168 [Pararhizobium capsulatum DSM 1112]|uniref:Uncharacterized protein n=1 Tax=Pararhizobium capsulatum DSM 1112 TaxID=1121113 RepID=A0ABU0BRB5_9HYPH|nr:hypothetical protein [Pararhizobium capsulatum]MDQ0320030.1 hypothetical protein [Pararhizobium capsulatum DSM 1112]
MTREEIIELFIRGAETDRRLPDTARPARLKSQSLPFIHSQADQNGWGGERYEEERASFWDQRSTRLKAEDISAWERCNQLVIFVVDESERRCLWHWSMGRAGGRPFKHWCLDEGIHVETGRRRKDRAISHIALALARNSLQNNETGLLDLLRVGPEIEHIHVNIADVAHELTWRDDGAFSPVAVPELRDFTWADKRNEMRRQRESERRKRQAA